MSRQAVERAEASQNSIRGLADLTSRIGDVVKLINDIAGQTNLLALNATIEAARAGEAGKGFAVVAGEVKALAAQTARATADIAGQIEMVRSATGATIVAVNEIGGMISQMNEVSTAIAAAVEQQGVTTREIAASVQGVSTATVQSAQAMSHVVEVPDRAGSASEQVIAGAADIGQQTERLRTEVGRFLAAVQTDASERRRFERIYGGLVSVTIRLLGHQPTTAAIKDLSLGGAALACSQTVPLGTSVSIDLPHTDGSVTGRVVRADGNVLGIEFPDDKATALLVGRCMSALAKSARAA